MTEYATPEALSASRLPTEDVYVAAVNGTVKIRALSRAEVLGINKGSPDPVIMERRVLAKALINPPMTEDEVGNWQKASTAGELEAVSSAVQRISGLKGKESEKAAYADFRGEPNE